jgi:elongation factor P--(R)-beta-lysine ligase
MSSDKLLKNLAAKKSALVIRHKVLAAVRSFFVADGFVEVDTPLLLSTVAPEEHITPLRCDGRVLATSPELQMKQLVAAGLPKVFQITRSFRKGERGALHLPEFAILEWYRPGDGLDLLKKDLEGLFNHTARQLGLGDTVDWQAQSIDLAASWPSTTVQDAFVRYAGWDPIGDFDEDRFELDLVNLVEPNLGLGRPEMLAYYPTQLGSLAKVDSRNSAVCQRAELYVQGLEIANGFVELDDGEEQRRRFESARTAMADRGDLPTKMPEDYLASLAHLPPTVGMALGLDRMAMLFANAASIDEVVAFTPDQG